MYLPLRSLSRALAGPSRVLVAEPLGPDLIPDVCAAPPLGHRLTAPHDDLSSARRLPDSAVPRDLLMQLPSSDEDEADEADEREDEGNRKGDHDDVLSF